MNFVSLLFFFQNSISTPVTGGGPIFGLNYVELNDDDNDGDDDGNGEDDDDDEDGDEDFEDC